MVDMYKQISKWGMGFGVRYPKMGWRSWKWYQNYVVSGNSTPNRELQLNHWPEFLDSIAMLSTFLASWPEAEGVATGTISGLSKKPRSLLQTFLGGCGADIK